MKAKQKIPYLFDQYNVHCFTPSPQSLLRDVLVQMINCLIKALNDTLKLPRLIVVIPEEDLLKFIMKPSVSVSKMSAEAFTWLMNQVDYAIEAKKDNLTMRKPGAVVFDPKIIWVKMINRIRRYIKTLANRKAFNETLEHLISNRPRHYLLDIIDVMEDGSLVDSMNHLNGYG